MFEKRKKFLIAAIFAVSYPASLAQEAPATILEIRLENAVNYIADVSDSSKFATDPNQTTPAAARTFGAPVLIADIVAVNGRPAKGTAITNQRTLNLRTSPTAGQTVSDVVRNTISEYALEILQPDGSPIGTLFALGFGGGPAPPGSSAAATQSNYAIVGGTGAFPGARGDLTVVSNVSVRTASVTEDPINQRNRGGGKITILVHLIPLSRPEVVTTVSGPSVFHNDFSPVTADKPARVGEILIVSVTNLGPTRPGVDPGKTFPQEPLQEVNSPVDVTVNGNAAQIVNKVGFPGFENMYRVDFRVPEGTAPGLATVQLSAAWIAGPEVKIPVR